MFSPSYDLRKQEMERSNGIRINRDNGGGTLNQNVALGAVVKNPPASAGDTGSSPGPGRSHMLHSD